MAQETTESISRTALAAACAVPVCSMLMLPGIALFFHRWNVHLFSTGSIVLLALGMLCFFPGRVINSLRSLHPVLSAAFGGLFAISLWHIFTHTASYRFADAGFTLLYVVLPLFGLVFRKELLKSLPWLFAVFWGLNLIACLIQRLVYGQLYLGIPSNINWNAALTVLTGAGTIWLLLTKIENKRVRCICAGSVFLVSVYILYDTGCRAQMLGLLVAGGVFLSLFLRSPKTKKIFRLAMLAGALCTAVVLAFLFRNSYIREIMQKDDRVYLAVTVPDMIADAPFFGYGAPSFEQEYLKFRTAAFFNLTHTTDRVDHPHNDILFVAAGYGLSGLLCWLTILGFTLVGFYRKYEECAESFTKLLFFLFLILLVHAQLDLVFFHIPVAGLALILPGILLGASAKKSLLTPLPRTPAFAVQTFGVLFSAAALYAAGMELYSSHMLWCGQGELMRNGPDAPGAWRYFERAYKTPQASPYTIFTVMSNYLWNSRERAQKMLDVCEVLDRTAAPDYAHVNCARAKAFQYIGDLRMAEKYYLRETELFPVHIIPYLILARLYYDTNRKPEFDKTQECIREIMTKRGLDARDLKIILEYPEFDGKPWEIPAEWRTKRTKL